MEKKKLSQVTDRQQFRIGNDNRIWWKLPNEIRGNTNWITCVGEGKWLPVDTEVEIVQNEEAQAINDIKVSQLCQSEDMNWELTKLPPMEPVKLSVIDTVQMIDEGSMQKITNQ